MQVSNTECTSAACEKLWYNTGGVHDSSVVRNIFSADVREQRRLRSSENSSFSGLGIAGCVPVACYCALRRAAVEEASCICTTQFRIHCTAPAGELPICTSRVLLPVCCVHMVQAILHHHDSCFMCHGQDKLYMAFM